ncbi:MAG: hypothetical protein GX754_02880 [Clostridiaceae bacterium]|nr:hypothetical protein [Clostridiaceae bacterium]
MNKNKRKREKRNNSSKLRVGVTQKIKKRQAESWHRRLAASGKEGSRCG